METMWEKPHCFLFIQKAKQFTDTYHYIYFDAVQCSLFPVFICIICIYPVSVPCRRAQPSRCGCAAVRPQKGWVGSGWMRPLRLKAAVSAQTRPTGGARGVRNYYMGLNMFSHWLSLAGHTGRRLRQCPSSHSLDATCCVTGKWICKWICQFIYKFNHEFYYQFNTHINTNMIFF